MITYKSPSSHCRSKTICTDGLQEAAEHISAAALCTAPPSPSAATSEDDSLLMLPCRISGLRRPHISVSNLLPVCEVARRRFNIHLLHGGPQNRQPRAVIGGPVLRDRRRAEEQLNHLDIHQEVATQKATAAVSSPID